MPPVTRHPRAGDHDGSTGLNTGSPIWLEQYTMCHAMTQPIEIIDAQVHLNQLVPDWRTASIDSVIATGIQAMDAVGIHRVLIGESHGFDSKMRPLGLELPNCAIRTDYPFSERAVELLATLDLSPLITRRFPLREIHEAIAAARDRQGVRVLVGRA